MKFAGTIVHVSTQKSNGLKQPVRVTYVDELKKKKKASSTKSNAWQGKSMLHRKWLVQKKKKENI